MGITFQRLDGRTKLWGFRKLVSDGLANYSIRSANLRLLRSGEKATFRVDVPIRRKCAVEGDVIADRCRRYVFCAYDPHYFDEIELSSELILLKAIRHETTLSIPEPVVDSKGALITSVKTSWTSEPWMCVLFDWVEGRAIESKVTELNLKRIGKFVARFHQYSITFTPPADFRRPTFDDSSIFGAHMGANLHRILSQLHQHEFSYLRAVLERVRQEFKNAIPKTESFGLIHGDLHPGNFLVRRQEISALDFDDCGWGYYLYDIAVLMCYLDQHGNSSDLKAALLRGYSGVRPLDAKAGQLLTTFMAAHRLRQTIHLLKESQQSWFRECGNTLIRHATAYLIAYLKS